jgi:tetratricopeptide (TPR) repeat protein
MKLTAMSPTTSRSRLLGLFLLVMPLRVVRAEQTWTEVRSPHFRVLTNGSGSDGRKVASEFEQMRHVFVLRFKDDQIGAGAPLTIFAVRDGSTFKELIPRDWKASKGNLNGEFLRGWEKQFAIMQLDTGSDENQVVVYHEYTHSVLHARFHWLPLWFDEGFAEFYAYTRFESDRILIGAVSERYGVLRNHALLKVGEMLDTTSYSSLFRDDQKVQLFYAEAWAMVHYMIFGPGMNNGEKMNAFYNLLQDEVPQRKAFEQTFGDLKSFDDNFSKYLNTFTLKAGVFPPDKGMNSKTFSERKLTPAEADYEIGCFKIGDHDSANGLSLIEKSLALDANLAPAHEELAFLYFREGKDADAVEEWKRAVALDPSLPRSLFALTMSGTSLAAQTPEQLQALQKTLQHITELAPSFAPAYVELALVEVQLGSMQQAYNDAHKAETLEPWRAGYHILTGRILLRGKQPALAANYSRYVAGHWYGPDHNEAVDLWLDVPAADRGDDPPLTLDMPRDTKVVTGTVEDVSCGTTPDARLTVTFRPDAPADAKPITFKSDGRLMIGFSDTFWWGEDHYTSCHHLGGHHGVVAYKEQDQKLLDLEVRDDIPEAKSVKSAEASATAPGQP